MTVKLHKSEDSLTAMLFGEIDHHSSVEIRECIDNAIKLLKPKKLIIDFGEVTFMDSSGVGLIMGRYKLMSFFGGTVEVKNVHERIDRILRLSGIEKIARIEKRGKAV